MERSDPHDAGHDAGDGEQRFLGTTMPIATMTSKGQLTIPKQVRETLMLDAGDQLEITLTGDGAALLRPQHAAVGSLFGSIAWTSGTVPVAAMDPGSADAP